MKNQSRSKSSKVSSKSVSLSMILGELSSLRLILREVFGDEMSKCDSISTSEGSEVEWVGRREAVHPPEKKTTAHFHPPPLPKRIGVVGSDHTPPRSRKGGHLSLHRIQRTCPQRTTSMIQYTTLPLTRIPKLATHTTQSTKNAALVYVFR